MLRYKYYIRKIRLSGEEVLYYGIMIAEHTISCTRTIERRCCLIQARYVRACGDCIVTGDIGLFVRYSIREPYGTMDRCKC